MNPNKSITEDSEHRTISTDDCWIYAGVKDDSGYPNIQIDGSSKGVHRIMYTEHIGAIPDGLTIDHLCRVTSCINPIHLEAVTKGENTLRRYRLPGEEDKCMQGHPLAGNVYRYMAKNGLLKRKCRECTRVRDRARYRLRKLLTPPSSDSGTGHPTNSGKSSPKRGQNDLS